MSIKKKPSPKFCRIHSPVERFWGNVVKTESCWLWTGKNKNSRTGHGRLRVNKRTVVASRFSWEIHKGPIPEGLKVLHHCDVGACVNPKHLYLGTLSDNAKDMFKRLRRDIKGENNGRSKLSKDQVLEILRRYRKGLGPTLAKEFRVSDSTILAIIKGKLWKHLDRTLLV